MPSLPLDQQSAVSSNIQQVISRIKRQQEELSQMSKDSMVWPMVPQGVGNSQVQYARDHAPEWDEEFDVLVMSDELEQQQVLSLQVLLPLAA